MLNATSCIVSMFHLFSSGDSDRTADDVQETSSTSERECRDLHTRRARYTRAHQSKMMKWPAGNVKGRRPPYIRAQISAQARQTINRFVRAERNARRIFSLFKEKITINTKF